MRTVYVIAFILLLIGGINWGLVGLFNFNLVSTIFGVNTFLTNLIYILVGVSALLSIGLIKLLDEYKD